MGLGTATPSNPLAVAGVIQSTTGGFTFPDGTNLTTGVRHKARMERDAAITITGGANAVIVPFDTVDFDVGGITDKTNGVIKIVRTGYYQVNVYADVATTTTSDFALVCYLNKNTGSGWSLVDWFIQRGWQSLQRNCAISDVLQLNAGDELALFVYSDDTQTLAQSSYQVPRISIIELQ